MLNQIKRQVLSNSPRWPEANTPAAAVGLTYYELKLRNVSMALNSIGWRFRVRRNCAGRFRGNAPYLPSPAPARSRPRLRAVRAGSGAQLELGAVVGGEPGKLRAVPGDDLPDPACGKRAEQVVARDEQLMRLRPRPGRGQQLGGQVGVEAGEGAPL